MIKQQLLETLTQKWKKIQFRMALLDTFGVPHPKISKELEKDGWTFEMRCPLITAPIPAVYTQIKTPEGEVFTRSGNPALHERYKQEKIKAAEKIFGMKHK